MSEHEVSRVVRAGSDAVFDVVSDVRRLPAWLPTVREVEPAQPGADVDVHVEGDAGGGGYDSDGFWRPSREQRRVEWGTPSRGGEQGTYAGWLQLEDRGEGRTEVVVHLSFFGDADGGSAAPPQVEQGLARSLDQLAALVES